MARQVRTPEVTQELLEEVVRRLVRVANPQKIVLFGSRARRDHGARSDLDLLVITESTEPRHKRAIPLLSALQDIMIPMDILVYTPDEVREWSAVRQAFPTTAIREGRILYERQD